MQSGGRREVLVKTVSKLGSVGTYPHECLYNEASAGAPTPLDCAFANLTYHAAITLFPSQAQNVDDALRGYTSFGHGCSFASGHASGPHVVSPRAASRHSRLAIYVTSDAVHARADGTAANPFASLAHALDWRRRHKLPHDIVLNALSDINRGAQFE